MRRPVSLLVAAALVVGGCGGVDSSDIAAAEAASTTSMVGTTATSTTTTQLATTSTTSITTTSTTSSTTTTTTTAPPPPEALALGTLQVVLAASEIDGSVMIPEPPLHVAMTVQRLDPGTGIPMEGESDTIEYECVDPDPGTVTQTNSAGDLVMSVTIRTFAIPLDPGDYIVEMVRISADTFGVDSVPLPLVPAADGSLDRPMFTVVADASCTFIGEITVITFRIPPLGPLESIMAYANDLVEPGTPPVAYLDPNGALVGGDIGLSLLADLIEGDLAGHTWWLDGQLVDEAQCTIAEAQF